MMRVLLITSLLVAPVMAATHLPALSADGREIALSRRMKKKRACIEEIVVAPLGATRGKVIARHACGTTPAPETMNSLAGFVSLVSLVGEDDSERTVQQVSDGELTVRASVFPGFAVEALRDGRRIGRGRQKGLKRGRYDLRAVVQAGGYLYCEGSPDGKGEPTFWLVIKLRR